MQRTVGQTYSCACISTTHAEAISIVVTSWPYVAILCHFVICSWTLSGQDGIGWSASMGRVPWEKAHDKTHKLLIVTANRNFARRLAGQRMQCGAGHDPNLAAGGESGGGPNLKLHKQALFAFWNYHASGWRKRDGDGSPSWFCDIDLFASKKYIVVNHEKTRVVIRYYLYWLLASC